MTSNLSQPLSKLLSAISLCNRDNKNCVHICDTLEFREQKMRLSESLEHWQGLIAKY
ncbi:hypothetical protein I79_002547 [Cricetulus griseus]|uniref:Uncharacterized protein n=1 Tax=Cricetulus griseus TaxID=10029 RepID=G3GXQ5_CRIGR|nr:hypothetical protein I79_002547 [Cricetulus griseus]